jgi:hypothetical protein
MVQRSPHFVRPCACPVLNGRPLGHSNFLESAELLNVVQNQLSVFIALALVADLKMASERK